MTLEKIISGGQTGVDIAALKAAKICNIYTGGWMPRGFRTDEGNKPSYAKEYGMMAVSDREYPTRTRMNIRSSCATLQIAANFKSRGEKLTAAIVEELKKPTLPVRVDINTEPQEHESEKIAEWIMSEKIKILNVAGNSESTCPGIEAWSFKLLSSCFGILVNKSGIIIMKY